MGSGIRAPDPSRPEVRARIPYAAERFRRDSGYLVALTYGPDTDWVRNVLAGGRCQLITRGRTVDLDNPRLQHDPSRSRMPPVVRWILGAAGITEFLMLDLMAQPLTVGDQIGDHHA